MSDYSAYEYLKFAIFYASWLYFPAAMLLGWLIVRGRPHAKGAAAFGLAGLSVLAYARFVEPRILLTKETEVEFNRCFAKAGTLRAALISDLHIGLFRNAVPVPRLAQRLSALRPDLVLIAGDFNYFLPLEKFAATFAPLGTIGAPVFAVYGNHDIGRPGPDVRAPLAEGLAAAGVEVLDNRDAELDVRGRTIRIVGLSDLWGARRQKLELIGERNDIPQIVLTHNPETVLRMPRRAPVDLLAAGHTHGGQINLPVLTCALTFACRIARRGLVETDHGLVFVTSGTGMVGLPMRFRAPPEIDLLNLAWRSCS